MSSLRTFALLVLHFFLAEAFVMSVVITSDVAGNNIWLRTFWDIVVLSLIIIPPIGLWAHYKYAASSAHLKRIALYMSFVIFLAEGGAMLLLNRLSFTLNPFREIIIDSVFFSAFATPSAYFWVLTPLKHKENMRTMSTSAGVALAILISATIFIFDMSLPANVTGDVPYVVLVLVGLWIPYRYASLMLAGIGTVLTLSAYAITKQDALTWVTMTNQGLAIFAIWVTAILATTHRRYIDRLTISEKSLSNALRIARLGSLEWDIRSGDMTWSDEVYRILGRTPQNVTPSYRNFLKAIHPDDRQRVAKTFETALRNARSYSIEHAILRPDGTVRHISNEGEVIGDDTRHPLRLLATLLDITERKQTQKQLRHMATHDVLTGLPTRKLCIDRLNGAMAMARRQNSKAAVLFVDLDGFKNINDKFGHDVGDQVLRTVATRISSCLREIDTVARIGGDEFIVVLSNITEPSGAKKVAQTIIDVISQPFALRERTTISASIGIAFYPDHGSSPETLIKRADEAMYAVKQAGKNGLRFAS